MIVEKNLEPLLIGIHSTIRQVLQRLDGNQHLIQLVIDDNQRLVATVTDGDIRRALIRGSTLDDTVEHCMHREPVIAASLELAKKKLVAAPGHLRCVPVVDEDGRPTIVVSSIRQTSGFANALIMAGGFGKRLGNRTRNTPKPLLPVAGRPILEHLIVDLNSNGLQRILIATHYMSDQIAEFAGRVQSDAEIDILYEETPLGTAGALGLLPEEVVGPLLMVNGDIVTRTDYDAMLLDHRLGDRDATIGAARYEYEIPFGVIEHADDGSLVGIREKPRQTHFVAAGIYILEPSVYRSVPIGLPMDMPDLVQVAVQDEANVGIFPIHEYWLDLGRPKHLQMAEDEKRLWSRN